MKKKIEKILAYKALNKDMTCRGFQYKEGETYKHDGRVALCESGFHSCENPIDIFKYYNPGVSVFHVVEVSGEIARHEEDSKVASSEIKIGVAINLHDLIGASVNFMFARKYIKKTSKHPTGDRSASSATGDRSASVCTGLHSKAMAGTYGCIALAWLNKKENRVEMRCAETGCGDGSDGKLKAEVFYSLDVHGNFVEEK